MKHSSNIRLKTAVAIVGALSLLGLNVAKSQTLVHNYDFGTSTGLDSVGNADGVAVGSRGFYNNALNTYANNSGNPNGLELNGPDVTNSAVAGITGSFTIEDFVNADSQNNHDRQLLFNFGGTSGIGALAKNGGFNNPYLVIDNNYLDLGNYSGLEGAHTIALTYDATSGYARAYVDGSLATFANIGTFNLQSATGTAESGIGSLNPYGFDGNGDVVAVNGATLDFAIYTGSLTADQIAADFDAGAPVSSAPTPPPSTPEPGTWALLLVGLGSLAVLRNGRRMFQV